MKFPHPRPGWIWFTPHQGQLWFEIPATVVVGTTETSGFISRLGAPFQVGSEVNVYRYAGEESIPSSDNHMGRYEYTSGEGRRRFERRSRYGENAPEGTGGIEEELDDIGDMVATEMFG